MTQQHTAKPCGCSELEKHDAYWEEIIYCGNITNVYKDMKDQKKRFVLERAASTTRGGRKSHKYLCWLSLIQDMVVWAFDKEAAGLFEDVLLLIQEASSVQKQQLAESPR